MTVYFDQSRANSKYLMKFFLKYASELWQRLDCGTVIYYCFSFSSLKKRVAPGIEKQ